MSRRLFGTFATFIVIIVITSADAAAQTDAPPAPPTPPRARVEQQQQQSAAPRTAADEEFELNITERRINEADYEASTAVEAGDVGASGLSLGVGVMLRAAEIDVLLRNVRGRVRFRGNLEPLLRRLGLQRREVTTPAPAPAPPPSNPSP